MNHTKEEIEIHVIEPSEIKGAHELSFEEKLSKTRYNGKIVIPDAFLPPDWYLEAKKEFQKTITLNAKEMGQVNKNLVKQILEQVILDGKIKPKYPLDKKNIQKLLNDMIEKYSSSEFKWRYQLLYEFSFFLSTLFPSSFSPESLKLPEEFKTKKEKILIEYEERKKKDRDKAIIWVNKALEKLAKELMEYFTEHNIKIVDLINSGAKGSNDDLRKLLLAVGLSINSTGDINDVILRPHTEGLTPTQFFNYSSQGIVSQYSKSVMTAVPGYLVRQIYTSMEHVLLSHQEDCKTQKVFEFLIPDETALKALNYRMYKDTKDGEYKTFRFNDLSDKEYEELKNYYIGKTIYLRSPLYCQAKDGICKTCLGKEFIDKLQLDPGDNLGLKIVGSFAESLVNKALKAAHTGLSLDKAEADLTQDLFKYCR